MFCGKCGKEIAPGSRFCGNCGWQVPDVEQAPVKNVCKNCGAELKEGSKFCGVCGAKVESEAVEQVNQPLSVSTAEEVQNQITSELVVKMMNRKIRITTPDGRIEICGTGKKDESFLQGEYKIEVFADDEICGSSSVIVD